MNFYKQLLAWKEKFWPLLLTIIALIIFYKYQDKIKDLDKTIDKLLETSLAVSGALLGFLLTILTIINSISTRRMHFVKTGGGFPLLNHYLKMAIWFDLINISTFFIYPLMASYNFIINYISYIKIGVVGIIIFTWLLNIRFSLIFIKLLTDPTTKE